MSDAVNWTFGSEDLDLDGDMTLIVARRASTKLHAWKIEFAKDATSELRGAIARTVERLGQLTARSYEPSLVIGDGDYLAVPDQLIAAAAPPLPSRRARSEPDPEGSRRRSRAAAPAQGIETDPQVRHVLRQASGHPLLAAPDLEGSPFLFYAVVVGGVPEARTAFVRKRSPTRALGPGLVFFHGDRLTRVTEPLLVLEDNFDLVVTPEGIAVLSQPVFEQLFRDAETLVERYPVWAKAFSTLGLDAGQTEILTERCRRDSRLAHRLRQIHESGHLAAGNVTAKQVFEEAKRLGINRDSISHGGKLDFSCADVGTLLKLLNDDLFLGGLSRVPFEAGSKFRQRSPSAGQ